VPIDVTERELRDALALVGEWDPNGTPTAHAALQCMGWEGTGPLRLRRYDVQRFMWHTLPRTYLATFEQRRLAAAALARTLEHLGGRAATYAELCRSAETEELFCAWEKNDPGAGRRFRELLARSGIEPPDTDLLAWDQMPGSNEALVRDHVATTLEEAIEEGRLAPDSTSFRRRQAKVANAALLEPWGHGNGHSRFDAVRAERVQRWLEHGRAGGSAERRAIVGLVADLLAADVQPAEPEAVRVALAPALWLLERAQDGIALTRTGALNRALVRQLVECWPAWWHAELRGLPSSEDSVLPLHALHKLLRRLRLIRRTGRQIVVTARGRTLRDDPPALLEAFARELLGGDGFQGACIELAAALLLDGATVDFSDALARLIRPAIVADGWHWQGESAHIRDIWWTIIHFLRSAEAAGIVIHPDRRSHLPREPFTLTEPGRTTLAAGLRARALAPLPRPI
jgi:hypothetical protein